MVKVTQNSWLGGQLDVEMMGRQDFAKYKKGASKILNFNLLKRGGLVKRQGFDHMLNLGTTTEAANSIEQATHLGIPADSKVRIIPFAYKKDHGMILIFAGSYSSISGSYGGGCFVMYTMKGVRQKTFSLTKASTVTYFTNSEIDEFDYTQCGYKLFIAHQNHAPSVIWTTEAKVNTAISGGTDSPLEWDKFDITGVTSGVPSITGAYQERIAPTEDGGGATYTERYKVSASFDDIESKACSEFYNESVINPISLTTSEDGTCVSISRTNTGESTSTTKDDGGDVVSTTTTDAVEDANVTKTYTNKVKKSCNGTKYYLPWSESQTIKLSIGISRKSDILPERINVYKKNKGYFGLIGTVSVGDTGSEYVNTGKSLSTEGSGITIVNSEVISTEEDERQYETTTSIENLEYGSGDYRGDGKSGYVIPNTGKLVITPETGAEIYNDSKIGLYTGKARITFTSWNQTQSQEDPNLYTEPIAASFSYERSTATSLYVDAVISYTKSDGTTVTGEAHNNLVYSITSGPVISSGTYAATGSSASSKANTFKKNYATKYSTWLGKISDECIRTITLNITPTYTKKTGTLVRVTSLKIRPSLNNLVIHGVSVASKATSSVDFTDKNITPDNSITPIDESYSPQFQDAGDYPASVSLYQQRLVWASSKNNPETVWMSAVGDFYDYTEHEIQNDDDAIEFSMPVTRFAKLNHIVEMRKLFAFNSACEWLIDSASSQKGITYETIRATPQSYCGSDARLKPLLCNNAILFVDRSGQSVRKFGYNVKDDGFAGTDISILSSSIFDNNNIVDWAYQQSPSSVVWCVLEDGTLASLNFIEEQEIVAWAVHKHGDPNARFLGISSSYALSPGLADIEDGFDKPMRLATTEEIFVVVEHDYLSPATSYRTIERMRVRNEDGDSIYNSVCLDSCYVTTGTFTLRNFMVGVNSSTGAITEYDDEQTVTVPTGTIIGYKIGSKMTSMYPIDGSTTGEGQYDIKSVANVGVRLLYGHGGGVGLKGNTSITYEPIRYDDNKDDDRSATFTTGTASLHSCDCTNIKPRGTNNRDGRIEIYHDTPYPIAILQTEVDYVTENEGGGK